MWALGFEYRRLAVSGSVSSLRFTYVQLIESSFLAGTVGLLDYLLLRARRSRFTVLKHVIGQIEAGPVREKRRHGPWL